MELIHFRFMGLRGFSDEDSPRVPKNIRKRAIIVPNTYLKKVCLLSKMMFTFR